MSPISAWSPWPWPWSALWAGGLDFPRWLAAGAAACLLLAADTPASRLLFDWFPGYGWFRVPNRLLFAVSFLGITLAGIGAEELLARCAAPRRGREKGWFVGPCSQACCWP